MNRDFVMETLFAYLQRPPMVFNFTADTTTGDATLASVSDTSGMLVGMPISGPGVAMGAILATIAPAVTLSLPCTADKTAAPLIQGFQTASRRLAIAIEEVDMPAMYLVDISEEHPSRGWGQPYFALINAALMVFSRSGEEPSVIPATALNNMLDALERAIYPLGSQRGGGLLQNLGLHGVQSVRIEGEVQKEPGHITRIASAIIPLRIAVNPNLETRALEG